MKVQINLDVASKDQATAFDLTVSAQDTVLSAKERIAAAQLIAFPEQDLVLDGEVLEDSRQLSECGVKDGMSLDFVVRASQASLAKQLVELLQARDLSSDELGLLYCYKHGVSINQALKTVGHHGKFQDFLKAQKSMLVANGLVTLAREDAALKPFSTTEEVTKILEAAGGSLDLAAVCSKFVQKFNASLASVAGVKPAEFLKKEGFVVTDRNLVSLKSAVPVRPPGLAGAKPAAPAAPVLATEEASEEVDSQQYLELHTKISGRSFNSKVTQALNEIVEVVRQRLFLNVEQVVKGGSVGKGTAISGSAFAEAVLFLAAMPAATMEKWLPPLQKAAAAVLREHMEGGQHGIGDVRIVGDAVRLTCKGLVTVDLRFSPAFASHGEAVEAMRSQGPDARRLLAAAFAKEKAQFIAKQPGQVKVTMRLLKWWRDQQQWSSELTRPSDDVLELVAVYSAVQTKPADQRVAIANAMSLLAKFGELRIVWSNYYAKEDIWTPLLHQRPLLMDPTNPFANVADPHAFDPQELMAKAQTTHFFW